MDKSALYLSSSQEEYSNDIYKNAFPVPTRHKRKGQDHLLSGLAFCGDCNSPMTYNKVNSDTSYLVCSSWKKHSNMRLCTSHSMREDIVIHAVLTELYALAKNIDTDELYFSCKKNDHTQRLINMLENNISENKSALISLYKDKCKGVVSEDDFIFMSEDLKKEISFYESQLECFSELHEERTSCNEVKKYISDILNFEKINKAFLCLLINKINIYSDKRIVIEFNFTEPP